MVILKSEFPIYFFFDNPRAIILRMAGKKNPPAGRRMDQG
jgi:hypothetical protein